MNQIEDISAYESVKRNAKNLFHLEQEFPEPIFRYAKHFVFLEFDAFSLEKFFKAFGELSKSSFFLTIDPDPIKYYYYYYKKYNAFNFSDSDSFSDYIKTLHKQPGENTADSIIDIVNSMYISSTTSTISVYGNRNLGCLVVGFEQTDAKEKFISIYGRHHIFSVEEALVDLFPRDYELSDILKLHYS